MPRSDVVRLVAALAAGVLTLVAWLALGSHAHASLSAGWDKASHGSVAFALVVLVYVATRSLRLAAPFAVVVAVAVELHLAWLSGQVAGLDDWAVDVLGITLACMVVARTRIPMHPSVTTGLVR